MVGSNNAWVCFRQDFLTSLNFLLVRIVPDLENEGQATSDSRRAAITLRVKNSSSSDQNLASNEAIYPSLPVGIKNEGPDTGEPAA